MTLPEKYYAPLIGVSSIIAGFLSSLILLFKYDEQYVIEWSPLLNFMGIITTLFFFFNYRVYSNIERSDALYRGLVGINVIFFGVIGLLAVSLLPQDLLVVIFCFLLAGVTLPVSKYYIIAEDFMVFAILSSLIVLVRPIILLVFGDANHGLLAALVVSQFGNALLYFVRSRQLRVKILDPRPVNLKSSRTVYDFSEFFCRAAFALLFFSVLSFHNDVAESVDYLLVLFAGILFALSNSLASYLESKVNHKLAPQIGLTALRSRRRLGMFSGIGFCIASATFAIIYFHPFLSRLAQLITGYEISVAACFVGIGLVATETLRLLCVHRATLSSGLFRTQARYGSAISVGCAVLWWLGVNPMQLLGLLEVAFICLYASLLIGSSGRGSVLV